MTSGPEREVDARLADWVDGRMNERDRERFVAEMRVSPQLRKELEDYERTVASVRAALQAPSRPVHLADRVLAAIAEGEQTSSAGPRWRNRSFVWSLSSAAALLVFALLVNSWSPGITSDLTATRDVATNEPQNKAEAQTRTETDKEKRANDDLGKVAQDARPARERLEEAHEVQDADRERAANPAPPKVPAPAAPAPAAPVTGAPVPAPSEMTESGLGAAITREKRADPATKPTVAEQPVDQLRSSPGAKTPGGGGGEQVGAEAEAQTELQPGAWLALGSEPGEKLPVVAVQVVALAEFSRMQDGKAAPSGAPAGTGGAGARSGAPPTSRSQASGAESTGAGESMRKSAQASELPQQLETFFKRQMTVSGGGDAGGEGWSAGGLQFTPIPAATTMTLDSARKDTEAKAQAESAQESRRGAGKDDAVPRVERSWLVEGSKEQLEFVVRQLSLFAGSGGMQLTTSETSAATLPPRGAPAAVAPGGPVADPVAGATRALPRFRVVLRFLAQPR